ncbi:MAG: RNA-binding protein, partial [Chitinispirillales bacterium]|nr:RNA-binding protein [Chitinispirillales bacterium]
MHVQKLYIGNLPYRATEEEVRELFTNYEPIHALTLISDRETGRPRGYGFIELEEPMAVTAMYAMENKMFGGRNLKISRAIRRSEKQCFYGGGG